MKILVISLVLLACLLGFGVFAYYYLDNTAGSLADKTTAIETKVTARQWQEAASGFLQLDMSWNKVSPKWTALVDHSELDNINITMSRAKQFMNTRDLSGLLSELGELKMLFKHVPDREAVNLKNVL